MTIFGHLRRGAFAGPVAGSSLKSPVSVPGSLPRMILTRVVTFGLVIRPSLVDVGPLIPLIIISLRFLCYHGICLKKLLKHVIFRCRNRLEKEVTCLRRICGSALVRKAGSYQLIVRMPLSSTSMWTCKASSGRSSSMSSGHSIRHKAPLSR